MGGSAKGKRGKAKGSSKHRKSSDVSRQTAASTSDPHASQRKIQTLSELEKTKDETLHTETDPSMVISGCEKIVVRALKILLYNRIEMLYAEAIQYLVAKNIELETARYAILMNGHAYGERSIFKNIVENSEKFLKSGKVTDDETSKGYSNFIERVESLMRMMMRVKEQMCIDSTEVDAMKRLVGLCEAPKFKRAARQEDIGEVSSKNVSSPEVLDFSPTSGMPSGNLFSGDDLIDWEDPYLLRLQEMESDDPKDVLVLSILKQHRELKVKLRATKTWALEKVRQAEEKYVSHLSELEKLRAEKLEAQQHRKNLTRLREMDAALWKAVFQIEEAIATMRHHELLNSELRETIERYTLDSSKSIRAVREVERRERKSLKKIAAWEEEKYQIQEQVEEEKQKILQLKEEMLQLSKALEESKEKLAKEKAAKEAAMALVAEEERLKNIAEANIRLQKASLQQQVEMTRQRVKEDLRKLEDEFANLCTNATPHEEYILNDSPEEYASGRECLLCSRNDVSVVFLPCAHQVLCSTCNVKESDLAWCPCCQARIDHKITVYGASS